MGDHWLSCCGPTCLAIMHMPGPMPAIMSSFCPRRSVWPGGSVLRPSLMHSGLTQTPVYVFSCARTYHGINWRPHGDSNPGYRRERAMSYTCRDVTRQTSPYFTCFSEIGRAHV